MNDLIPIQNMIFEIRGQKVMIDRDLAFVYGVKTFRFNESIKRNIQRFPNSFMFKLNDDETKELIANCDRFKSLKHSTSNPYAFTEHGVLMASNVLNSEQAIQMSIQIINIFVNLRQYTLTHKEFSQRLLDLENHFMQYAKDNNFEIAKVNQAINYLMDIAKPEKIGFKID